MTAASEPRIDAVSVVVCNYDGEAHLPHCLDAVARLAGPVAEVLLVDNASTDGSVALVEARYPDVRVVHSGSNAGPAFARNLGMREARSRWVLALDNDAVCAPDLLEKLIAAAESRSGVAVVQPRSVFDDDPERVHYDGGAFHYAGLIALRNFYAPLASAQGSGVVEVDCAVSVGLLLDRELVLGLGGYEEAYFILFEDLDLSYRLRASGRTILSVEDALLRHRGGTAGISFREGPRYPRSRVFYHSRNRWLFLARCYRTRTLVVAAPGLLAYELAWFAFALLGGNVAGWLRGKREFLGLLPRARRARRALEEARVLRDRELLVGGPLTTTPDVARNGARRIVLGALDVALRAWWGIARHLAG